MNTDRTAALAIITGTVAGLVTMATHPTGHDVIRNASEGASNALNVSAHLLAIVAQPLVLGGTVAITRRLRARPDLAVGALIFFAMASVMVVIAATLSGLVATATLRGYADAAPGVQEAMHRDLAYTGALNQGLAKVHVALSAIAILLWSTAMLRAREFGRWIALYGLALGTLLAGLVATETLTLDIHGFGLVVITEGVWFVWAARTLWGRSPGD
jgi:hypothetical protein